MRFTSLALLALSACVTSANFDTTVAASACEKAVECDQTNDQAACEDQIGGGLACFEEHCTTFDGKAANACVKAVHDATCDEGVDLQGGDCGDVWSDCSELELAACLAASALGG